MEDDENLSDFKGEEEKPVRLSLHLIVKRHLPHEAQKWDQEDLIAALNKITHLRLDREKIREIDSLELLGDSVTNVYLQSNLIEQIENLDCLKNITFISLSNNKIKVLENLKTLKKLIFLDLSENCISEADINELPQSLIILNLLKNPCTSYPFYRKNMIQGMSRLKQLDLRDITNTEKRDVGLDVSSDEDDDDGEEQQQPVRNTGGGNGHGIEENFQTIATTMMLQSQRRAEDALQEHKNHSSEKNMIQGMSRLKQLDLRDITNTEKRDVGLDVSSDEDDDDGEEQQQPVRNTGGGNGHGIEENFQTIATTMMLRSQRRAEDALQEHKNHSSELDDLRIKLNIPPSARRTNRSSVNF